MAGPIGTGPRSDRQRVFVLVDKGIARGVFFTWDAAEAFADEHRLSLDQLMEYETRSDSPDHLHLLAAIWDDDWEFQGEWTKKAPKWPNSPKKVRLDHYHAQGNRFHLLRQKEFDWEDGLLQRVNPMAPDSAIKQDTPSSIPPSESGGQWRPKLSPLKPINPANQRKEGQKAPSAKQPLLTEPEPQIKTAEAPTAEKVTGSTLPLPPKAKPSLVTKGSGSSAPSPPVGKTSTPPTKEQSAKRSEAKISFQKRRPLRLKSKDSPQPIPDFKPTVAPSIEPGGSVSSVELAQAQHEAAAKAQAEKEKAAQKVRRVWSIRLILSVVFLIGCWTGGIYWVLRPEPTAAKIVAQVASLKPARVKIFEPEMIFFQLKIDPAHQERWISSLRLQPLRQNQVLKLPTYHALDTWEQPDGFIRPPYSETEVSEWWNLRIRNIQYGFIYTWDDGSLIILDLESDTLIGWAKAKLIPELLN